jgi:hypothetical protein
MEYFRGPDKQRRQGRMGKSAVDLPTVGRDVEVVGTNSVPQYLIHSIMPMKRVRN